MLPKPLLVALAIVTGSASMAETPTGLVFPTLEADTLTGRTVSLPRDLPGDPTIILVAFSQDAQETVNAWVRALGLRSEGGPDWVEVPAVSRPTRLIKGLLDGWMRDGIPDPAMRDRTITVYVDQADLRRRLGLPWGSDAAALVVARDGSVILSVVGPPTEQEVARFAPWTSH